MKNLFQTDINKIMMKITQVNGVISNLKDLMNNKELTGTLPENIGRSPRLKDFWVNDNQLTGTLPIIAEGEFLFFFLGEYFI